jgi:hypothetical protein
VEVKSLEKNSTQYKQRNKNKTVPWIKAIIPQDGGVLD